MESQFEQELEQLRRDINACAELSAGLEPPAPRRAKWSSAVNDYCEQFLESMDDVAPAYRLPGSSTQHDWSAVPEEGNGDIDALLKTYAAEVDGSGLNPASGGHLAYIPGGGIYPSALGDMLAAIGNRYAGVAYASPGAVAMENGLIRWMADLVGFPATTAGTLLSGGSLANLTAIVTARDAAGLKARDVEHAVVYSTAEVHHCVDKALQYAGMAEVQRRIIPVDGQRRMRVDLLREAIREDAASGQLKPWLIIASAGTTNTGAVDPLDAIADVAADAGVWYHIDAAYGGFFMLSPQARERLRGIERADSLVLDPHKGLFLPYGTGAVLVRDRETMLRAHRYNAHYMQDASADEISPAEISPELTRHFRGPRLWLAFQLIGVAAFRASLEEKLLLARYAYRRLSRWRHMDLLGEPDLSIVAFRFVTPGFDADELNRSVLEQLRNDGRIFISSTNLDGCFTLRLAVLSFRTHESQINLALELLNDAVYALTGHAPAETEV